MPTTPRETVLCRYHYDPLDRLVDCAQSADAGIQRFYCKDRLATEIQGAVQCSVFQHDDQLLAQLRREDAKVGTTLLATDQQRSVLTALDATRPHPIAYTPYGHRPRENGLMSLLGFNGERPDPMTGHYLLGNGYRGFNPVLMRFNSPDSWIPFGKGGLNAYAYCGGDPRNWTDSTGHYPIRALSKAMADYRAMKKKLQISPTSKTISKPAATKTDNIGSTTLKAKKTEEKMSNSARRLELEELANLIEINEAALSLDDKARYTWAEPNDDLSILSQGYRDARAMYKFKGKYPDTDVKEEFEGYLDVGAFDTTKMYFLRLTSEIGHNFSTDPATYHRAIILRAVYIKNQLGIDLMSIRQQSA